MTKTNNKYLLHHLQLIKVDEGFLFGTYQLKYCTPNVTQDILKYFEYDLKVAKHFGIECSYPNPNKIGYLINGDRQFSDLFFIPKSINHLFHASIESTPKNHLLLIEHPWNEKTLELTVVHASAHTPYWGMYTKEWQEGKFEERIQQFKKQLIDITLGEL